MQTVMTIQHRVFGSKIISTNPPHIPRKDDLVDMGIEPAPRVTDIIWKFKDTQNEVHIFVN